jgi:hypothetical protein
MNDPGRSSLFPKFSPITLLLSFVDVMRLVRTLRVLSCARSEHRFRACLVLNIAEIRFT